MITIRQNTAWGLRGASRVVLLCVIHALYAGSDEARPAKGFAGQTTKSGVRGGRD